MVKQTPTDSSTLINCHQCKAKREPTAVLQCTFSISRNASKPTNTHRCSAKYCRNCLKNRYNEDLDRITATTRGQKENGHADATYIFKCPKCRGQCSCWTCRNKAAHKLNLESNRSIPANSAQRQTILDPSTSKTTQIPAACIAKPLVLPNVTWSEVPIQFSLKEAEDRIFIREFIMRFSNLRGMSIPKAQLEELDFIGGFHEPNDAAEDERGEYPDWVSEVCVKSLVLSLIGVLAAEEDSSATLVMKNAMKDIRNAGANLTKMWAILSTLREALGRPEKIPETDKPKGEDSDDESSEDRIIIEFPDPYPPPVVQNVRSTRSASSTDFSVVHTAQMIPVILGLIETVLESHAIRVELEEGAKEGREKFRESRECIKLENELWDIVRKTLEEAKEPDLAKIKFERQAHKSRVQGFENAAKVIAPAFTPRFSPLGTDASGRTYWALTPGIHDREYAFSHIASRLSDALQSRKTRKRRHRHQKEEEDREALKDWAWFLAVHGTKPSGKGKNLTSDANESPAADRPRWWGFWDPEEIHKLAEWLSITNGAVETNDSSRAPLTFCSSEGLKFLVKGIKEYATLLEWRGKGEDEDRSP
ncbi:hypothetical protein GYMLUDRAFT_37176 [Collybiopsis luxurians FD-317 M1]|nr:hypothetical protein GYMLUDRAFT_37176 [Collybiopsis luxurians FD-317 M1]